MRQSKFTETQIVTILREADAGRAAVVVRSKDFGDDCFRKIPHISAPFLVTDSTASPTPETLYHGVTPFQGAEHLKESRNINPG